MLTVKKGKEILMAATSKERVIALFRDKYGCRPAIRMIRKEYIQTKDETGRTISTYNCTFHCDSCGHTFMLPEGKAESLKCPECGFSAEVKRWSRTGAYIDQAYDHFSYVLGNDGEILGPCLVLYERVKAASVEYKVMRRFHFTLEQGQIVYVRMHRCIIVGNSKIQGGILLYEDGEGKVKKANSEYAYGWFKNSKYHEIQCCNLIDLYDDTADEGNKIQKILNDLNVAYQHAKKYYSAPLMRGREINTAYPVAKESDIVKDEYGQCLEVYRNYFVLRSFRGGLELYRWVYCPEDTLNVLLTYSDSEWMVEDTGKITYFNDENLLRHRDKIKGTFLEKIGLLNILQADDEDIFESNHSENTGVSFLNHYSEFPIIETLLKIGLGHLNEAVCSNSITVHMRKRHIWQMLGLSKSNYSLLYRLKLDSKAAMFLQYFNQYDESVDENILKRHMEKVIVIDRYRIDMLMKERRFTLKQMVDFFISAEENQGCAWDSTLEVWSDYLKLYKGCYGHEPKDKTELYPDSLKKAHDILTMRSNKNEIGGKLVSFSDIVKQWKKLQYADQNFCILLPESSADLERESHELGHCVRSYCSSVLDGTCLILFLRRTDMPDKPFFTLEYDCRGRIYQIKGKGNRLISEISDKHKSLRDDLTSFLVKWGAKNGIVTGFEKSERKVS